MQWQTVVMIALGTWQAMLAAAIVAGPEALGVPQIAVNWASILNVGVLFAANQMKRMGAPRTRKSRPVRRRPAPE